MTTRDMHQPTAEIKTLDTPHQRWVAINVDMFNHPVVGAPKDEPWAAFMLWAWMVASAAYKDQTVNCEGQGVFVRRGQLAVSLRFLARKANWGVKAVRVFLSRLERHDMISTSAHAPLTCNGQLSLPNLKLNVVKRGTERGTGKGTGRTVVTICNYDKYQNGGRPKGTGWGTDRGTAGAQRSTIIPSIQEERASKPSEVLYATNPEVLANLNGAHELIIEQLAKWINPMSPDRDTAARTLTTQVGLHGGPVVKQAFGELKAQIDSGALVSRPIVVLNKACERIKATKQPRAVIKPSRW